MRSVLVIRLVQNFGGENGGDLRGDRPRCFLQAIDGSKLHIGVPCMCSGTYLSIPGVWWSLYIGVHEFWYSIVLNGLVVDKDTGKPKGYGFCVYKDEETALSALRNLKGYMIHGRQLRINLAENGKNAERNRDQIQLVSSQCHPSHLAQTGNPNLVMPQQPVPPQKVPITTSVGPSIFQAVQTHPNLAASGGLVPQLQSTVLQQNLRPSFGVANFAQQPASAVVSISMPKKQLARLASQVVPSTEQQLPTRAEMLQSEVNPWSELNHASKRRRYAFTDITNDWSAVNTPSSQAACQMPTAAAMQPEKLPQELSAEEQSFLLQQVLRLTPDQLNSLPMEVQQQVFQLQKAHSSGSW